MPETASTVSDSFDVHELRLLRSVAAPLLAAILALGACGGGASPPEDSPPEEAPQALLIVGATLISPDLPEPFQDAWVSVEEGRITGLGTGDPPPATTDFERLNASGRFLVPGLIDAHVHLSSVPGMAYQQQQAHRDLVAAYFRQMPRSYLFHGFTTVIDLALDDAELVARLEESPAHPDVFGCASPAVLANGYPMVFAPPKIRFKIFPNFLYDPRQAETIPRRYRPAEHSPAAAVRRVQEAGGICVKTFVEDGFGAASSWPVPPVQMLQELAAESRKAGLPLLVHANSAGAYDIALEGGADVLVHGLWTWDGHEDLQGETGLPPAIAGLLDRAVGQGVATMPTLRVIAGDRALFDPEFLKDPALARVLPRGILAWYGTDAGQWFHRQMLDSFPPEIGNPQAAYDGHTEALRRGQRAASALAAREDSMILFGSDTPSGPSYGNPPGYNGYLELRALAAAGLSLDRLLAGATLHNARVFGLQDRYGTISPGKVAHLLLLSENPLETVAAYDSIETVILHGRPIERSRLTAVAAEGSGRGPSGR